MSRPRFGQWLALACMGALAACTSQGDGGGPSGNTQLNLILNGGNIEDEFFTARYAMACDGAGTDENDTPDGTPIDDARTFQGDFEVTGDTVADGRILEVATQLPLGECALTIFVEDEDEVICTGNQTITIGPGTIATNDPNVFNILLTCDVSFQSPFGDAIVNAGFEEVTGNFCPQANILNSLDRTPDPGVFEVGVQLRAYDFDNTCGGACDCTSAEGVVPGACSSVPPLELDFGLTAACCAVPAGSLTGNPDLDSQIILGACVAGVGAVGSFNPSTPINSRTDTATPGILDVDFVYDCAGGSPAAGAVLPACVITDGDTECGKIITDRAPTVCPGDNQCDGSASCTPDSTDECADGQGGNAVCGADGTCPPVSCVDATNDCFNYGICNIATGDCPTPEYRGDGTSCSTNPTSSLLGQCQGGADAGQCVDRDLCVENGVTDCTDNNYCTADGTCDPATGQCPQSTPANDGEACTPGSEDAGGPGVCNDGGVCVVSDPPPASCDPLAGDEGCEIACNAAANDFGLPTVKTIDPGDLSGATAEVCFSGAVPLTEEFIEAANVALNTTFAIGRITPGVVANSGSPQTLTFAATVGATGENVAAPGPQNAEYDLLDFPPTGAYFIPFPDPALPAGDTETCGTFTLPASGETICFNITGSSSDTPSVSSFAALAIDTTGYNNLVATFNCGPADPAGLGVDCTPDDPSVCAGTDNCELDAPCTEDADCTVNGIQTGACDTTEGLCDTAGTCEVSVIDDPNAGELCFVVP